MFRRSRRLPGLAAVLVALVLSMIAVAALASLADGAALRAGARAALDDPAGLALIGLALFGAFSLRAWAWSRMLPGLGFGQSLAALHVSLGANHLLPFRLGEPMRIVSVIRRTDVEPGPATSTTVVLRAADVLALLLLGMVAGPRFVSSTLGAWGLLAGVAVAAVGVVALRVVVGQRRGRQGVRPPGPTTVAVVFAAWLLEAVVVWRAVEWFGVDLSPVEALVVLSAAVSAQLLAVTPAGIGTYEAAATAAMVAAGVPLTVAVTAAIALHGVKTIYSLGAGLIAVFVPGPGLLGRWRMQPPPAVVPAAPAGPGPVVLFLPAHDEAPRIATVIAAAPAQLAGRPVEVVVVDDGSGDGTVAATRAAGAVVVEHGANRGLGAAVRTGLAAGVARGAAAVAFCDADGEYDPGELEALVTPILRGEAHYVVGTRFGGTIRHMRPHRRAGNRLLTRGVRFVTRRPVTDGQSGFRALSRAAAAEAAVAHDYNYAQVLTVELLAKGYGYREVPISYAFRTSGRSFIRLGTYLRHVVPAVWRLLNPGRSTRPAHPQEGSPSCDTIHGSAASPLSAY